MRRMWATPALDDCSIEEWRTFFKHLAELKYFGIEPLISEPYKMPHKQIISLVGESGLKLTGLRTGAITAKHGVVFNHPDKSVRDEAVQRVIEITRYGSRFGSPRLLVGLLQGPLLPGEKLSEAVLFIVECLHRCAIEAAHYGMEIDVEPINRFELDYNHTVSDVITLIQQVGQPNVRLLIDTYHMSIEESSISEALIQAQPLLGHVHLADSKRMAPGLGHFDFREFFTILKDYSYKGDVTIEISNSLDPVKDAAMSAAYLNMMTDFG